MVNHEQHGVEKRSFRLDPIHIPLSVSIVGWFVLVVLLPCDVTWGRWYVFIVFWGAFGIRMARWWSGCVLERVLSALCGWVSVHRCVRFLRHRERHSVWITKGDCLVLYLTTTFRVCGEVQWASLRIVCPPRKFSSRSGVPSWEAGKPHPDSEQVVAGWHFAEAWPSLCECFRTRISLRDRVPDHNGIFGPYPAVDFDRWSLISAGRGYFPILEPRPSLRSEACVRTM